MGRIRWDTAIIGTTFAINTFIIFVTDDVWLNSPEMCPWPPIRGLQRMGGFIFKKEWKMSRVLIVDDSSTMRKIIQKNIKAANLIVNEFIEASDGKNAIEILQGKTVDMIICDWNMPNMTGIEFVRAVQNSNAHKNIPIIMVTTEGSNGMKQEAMVAGAKCYITKPFTQEELLKELGRYLMV